MKIVCRLSPRVSNLRQDNVWQFSPRRRDCCPLDADDCREGEEHARVRCASRNTPVGCGASLQVSSRLRSVASSGRGIQREADASELASERVAGALGKRRASAVADQLFAQGHAEDAWQRIHAQEPGDLTNVVREGRSRRTFADGPHVRRDSSHCSAECRPRSSDDARLRAAGGSRSRRRDGLQFVERQVLVTARRSAPSARRRRLDHELDDEPARGRGQPRCRDELDRAGRGPARRGRWPRASSRPPTRRRRLSRTDLLAQVSGWARPSSCPAVISLTAFPWNCKPRLKCSAPASEDSVNPLLGSAEPPSPRGHDWHVSGGLSIPAMHDQGWRRHGAPTRGSGIVASVVAVALVTARHRAAPGLRAGAEPRGALRVRGAADRDRLGLAFAIGVSVARCSCSTSSSSRRCTRSRSATRGTGSRSPSSSSPSAVVSELAARSRRRATRGGAARRDRALAARARQRERRARPDRRRRRAGARRRARPASSSASRRPSARRRRRDAVDRGRPPCRHDHAARGALARARPRARGCCRRSRRSSPSRSTRSAWRARRSRPRRCGAPTRSRPRCSAP